MCLGESRAGTQQLSSRQLRVLLFQAKWLLCTQSVLRKMLYCYFCYNWITISRRSGWWGHMHKSHSREADVKLCCARTAPQGTGRSRTYTEDKSTCRKVCPNTQNGFYQPPQPHSSPKYEQCSWWFSITQTVSCLHTKNHLKRSVLNCAWRISQLKGIKNAKYHCQLQLC